MPSTAPCTLALVAAVAMVSSSAGRGLLPTNHLRPQTRPDFGVAPSAPSLDPCKLLTKEQVATVLPNNDGGEIAHAGGSLIAGVDAYQCSYLDPKANVFSVVVNIAVDDQRFAKVRPHFASNEATKVPVGEGGWLRGEPDDMKLTAVKGRTVLDLELLAPTAGQKGPALVVLAQAAMLHL